MAKTKWFILAAGAALALQGTAAFAQDAANITFSVAGQDFTATGPKGFCLPEGANKAISDAVADLDKLNFTHANFRDCAQPLGDYSIIKSERQAKPVAIGKPLFIAVVAKQLESELAQQQIAQGMETGSRDVAEGTGNQIKLKGSGARSEGFDKDCVYIAGDVAVAAGGMEEVLNFVTCLTLVGGRVFAVHSYSVAEGGAGIDALKARSRAIAVTIATAS